MSTKDNRRGGDATAYLRRLDFNSLGLRWGGAR